MTTSTDEVTEHDRHVVWALRQTFERGATYAVVPVPWWTRFCDRAGTADTAASGVPWGDLCMFPEDGDGSPIENVDDEGNVILCLLPMHHDGPCARPGTLAP